ncbi:MAG: aminopeptidase [Myxococcota bacterium]
MSAFALLASALLPSCTFGYVVRSGIYQAELLASREPIDEVLADGGLAAGEEQRLRLVPEIKAYGKTLGLKSTENYDTLAVGWDRTIWNLSACEELSFQPVTWWFPVVGRVPYLGFFDVDEARAREQLLKEQGYETHLRTAGAYSTLGWFRDPVLPGMLRWPESDLAETVFHELAHATLWIPGSVSFNESFASFVGEAAAKSYLAHKYGPDAPETQEYLRAERDYVRFEKLLHGLYRDLDELYGDPKRTDEEKRTKKAELYNSLQARVVASDIEDRDRYLAALRRSPWNNARLMQFRTYNTNEQAFEALYAARGGDLLAFVGAVDEATRGQPDPFAAIEAAAAAVVKNP